MADPPTHSGGTRPVSRRSAPAAMALGGAITVACNLPIFLTGALAVQLMHEFTFGAGALGLAVAMWRVAAALVSPFLGRACDRLGAIWSVRIAAAVAATSALGIATTAQSWGGLVAWLMFGGCAHALGQPAANRLLSNAVQPGRLGVAFGVKQSAPPVASMLAGASVPLVALTVGWRWAYVIAAVLSVVVAISAGRRLPRAQRPAAPGGARRRLAQPRVVVTLAVAFGLGTLTSSAVTTFYVEATVQIGTPASLAGTMLAVASLAAVASRLLCGVISDRLPTGHLRLCAGLLAFGSLGILLLALGTQPWNAIGAVLALTGSWGFNGVFWYALVRTYPDSPGAITGALAPGALLGSMSGPLLFGGMVEVVPYGVAWATVAAIALLAAVGMGVGNRLLPSEPVRSGPEPAVDGEGHDGREVQTEGAGGDGTGQVRRVAERASVPGGAASSRGDAGRQEGDR